MSTSIKMIDIKETKRDFVNELLKKDIHKVLDLGCGEMLLSKPFLKNKSFVKGIDLKEPYSVPEGAVFVKGNFFHEEFEKDYELIIASLILHLTKKEFAPKLIKKIQDSTAKRGYNFLILVSNKDSLSTEPSAKGKFYVSMDEITELSKLKDEQINRAKEVLAYEVTKIVHGQQKASDAQDASKALFENIGQAQNMPSKEISVEILTQGFDILDALLAAGFIQSKSEGRRLIQEKCVLINNNLVEDFKLTIENYMFPEGEMLLRKGKKKYFKFILK